MVKEVETICTYDLDADGRTLRGAQRTATFLVADAGYTSQASLAEQAADRMLRGPSGRSIACDIRLYDVVYERAS